MGKTNKSGKGGKRKIGRSQRKPSQKRYNAEGHRDRNKRKRILKSNGLDFLQRWETLLRKHKP